MTPAAASPALIQKRSGAVTVIGVIFLSISVMWLAGVLFQGVFFAFLASLRPGGVDLTRVSTDANVPAAVRLIVQYAKLFWLANIVAAAFVALSSIGLLRRKNWSRIVFLFVAVGGVIYSLGTIVTSILTVTVMRSQMRQLEAIRAEVRQ